MNGYPDWLIVTRMAAFSGKISINSELPWHGRAANHHLRIV
jgi:hypothetical protein